MPTPDNSFDPDTFLDQYSSSGKFDPDTFLSSYGKLGSLSDIWQGLNEPLVKAVPRPFPEANPQDSAIAATFKGAANLPSDVVNFLQSPIGATTALVGGGLPKAIQTLVGAGFTTQQAIQALSAQTTQERAEALLGAGLAGVGTAAHGLRGGEEVARAEPVRPASEPEATQAVPTAPAAPTQATGQPAPAQAPLETFTARYQPTPPDEAQLASANAEAAAQRGAPVRMPTEATIPAEVNLEAGQRGAPAPFDNAEVMASKDPDSHTAFRSLAPEMAKKAQKVYDEWNQDEHGMDEEYGGGGICQDIAAELSGVLNDHGIDAQTIDNEGMGEQHVWVIAKMKDGIYEIDIPPSVYETGGGYSWTKRQGVQFDETHITVGKIDDLENADQYGFEKGAPEAQASPEPKTAAPNVREPLSLDELRLMRERSELQFQKELLDRQRLPSQMSAGIDDRISQINDELDAIANREAAPAGAAPEKLPKGFGAPRAITPVEELNRQAAATYGAPKDVLANIRKGTTFTPDEETTQGAFRPQEETRPTETAPKVGEPARQQSAAPQRTAGMANPPPPATGAAARSVTEPIGVAETYAESELGKGAVIPGEGVTWQEARQYGTDQLNRGVDPRAPIRVAEKSGRSGWKEVGIVSAEYERRALDRRKAASELANDPTNPTLVRNYANAEKAQVDWRREMQPVLTKASDALRAAQGERYVNTSDYQDLVDLAYRNMKKDIKELTPAERTGLARVAKDGQAADESALGAGEKMRQAARSESGGKTMTLDELRKASEDFVKSKLADCVV